MKNIAIIGCTSKKKGYACTAIELYQESPFFCKELKYAREVIKASKLYILSAKHHLIHESILIEPYNTTLVGMPKAERVSWAQIVLSQIYETFDPCEDRLYFLCGKRYYEYLEPELIKNSYQYDIPLKGIGGIGKQLHWLDLQTND